MRRGRDQPTCVIEDITEQQEEPQYVCGGAAAASRSGDGSPANAASSERGAESASRHQEETVVELHDAVVEQQNDQESEGHSERQEQEQEQQLPSGTHSVTSRSQQQEQQQEQQPEQEQQQEQQQEQEQQPDKQPQGPEQQQQLQQPWAPSCEEERRQLDLAEALKREGNDLFGQQRYDEALAKYQEALDAAPEQAPQRSVYYANMAACCLKLDQPQLAAEHCSCALRIDGGYIKALMRRSMAFEQLDDLDHALADVKQVLELDPSNRPAAAAAARLQPIVAERQEKLKDEMLGKLKDLGNTILGKFGLSLDNFKAEQDPATGGYSIKFSQ